MKTQLLLRKAESVLTERLEQLQTRVQEGQEAAWGEMCEVVRTLAQLHTALLPEHGGAMLTTAEMASRLGVSPKTLLRHKKEKRLRWSGQERLQ